ncbi:MAG: hypothetical protein ACE5JR_11320 [Gemmatimonadota bacterium]
MRSGLPDTLGVLHLELYQNLHASGAARHEPVEVTGGVVLRRVAAPGSFNENVAEDEFFPACTTRSRTGIGT